MSNTKHIRILDVDVGIVAYKGERVVTFAMVDRIHQRPDGTAGRTFRDNRERFVEGVDYFEPTSDEIRRMSLEGIFPERTARGKLITRRGYLKLIKPMSDDRAWAVQGEMIDRYFEVERMAGAIADDLGPAALLKAHLEVDERAVAVGYKPALLILVERMVPTRKRRAFSQKVSARLRRFSADHGYATRISRESGRYLFQVEAINAWLIYEGERMIRDHVDALTGQGVLHLVRP
jgi:ORF6N domain